MESNLLSYDIISGNVEIIAKGNICSYIIMPDKIMYIYRENEGLFILEDGGERCLREAGEDTISVALACDGDKIYLDNSDTYYLYNRKIIKKVIVCNSDGKDEAVIPYSDIYALNIEMCDHKYIYAFSMRPDASWSWAYIDKRNIDDAKWSYVGD